MWRIEFLRQLEFDFGSRVTRHDHCLGQELISITNAGVPDTDFVIFRAVQRQLCLAVLVSLGDRHAVHDQYVPEHVV